MEKFICFKIKKQNKLLITNKINLIKSVINQKNQISLKNFIKIKNKNYCKKIVLKIVANEKFTNKNNI